VRGALGAGPLAAAVGGVDGGAVIDGPAQDASTAAALSRVAAGRSELVITPVYRPSPRAVQPRRALDRPRERGAGRSCTAGPPCAPLLDQPPQVDVVVSSVVANPSFALLISSELLLIALISLSRLSSCLLLARIWAFDLSR
jgi:hypothetical protein